MTGWVLTQRVMALLLLVVLAPLEALIAAAVVLDSGRPALHLGPRMGLQGRRITIHKFRTMRDGLGGPDVTGRDDVRVTRIGRILRRTRLDELPQLWDVARGVMLLVGPRPEAPAFVDIANPAWREILSVRPGITGPTQLRFLDEAQLLRGADPSRIYRESVLPMKMAADLAYVHSRSWLGDIRIMLETLFLVVRGRRQAPTAEEATSSISMEAADDHSNRGPSSRSDALRLLVLADANSIHTERWVRGLAESGPVALRLVTMNPAGVRTGLRDIPGVLAIDEFYAGKVKPGGGNWRYLLNAPRIVRAARRMKPDAILTIYLSSYGLMGAIAKGDAGLVHVVIGSDVMPQPGRARIYDLLSRWTLARGDLCVSASRTLTARLSDIGNVPSGAILTQQYGLEDWVLGHALLPKDYLLVSNRAWVPNSQIPKLLRTFGRVKTPGTLALVGGASAPDTEIEQLAAKDPRVTPLGVLAHRKSVEVVARSAFYFSMTASDGASLSLMEAMAVGAIPIVSDIEPNREWVEHGVNGALIPLDDELSAAGTIDSFISRPEGELDEIRRHNREIVRERGSLTRNMSTFRDRLDVVLAQRKGSDL